MLLPSLARRSLAAALMAAPAAADVTFNNFSNPAGLNLIGDAQVAGTTLELVPDANNDTGAAWFQTKQAVGNGFSTQFTFAYGTGGGGEGMAFVIQNVTSSELGAGQCGLGYDGITNSLAIEFDTVGNATCGGQVSNEPSNLHISIQTRGGLANSSLGTFSLGSAQVVNDFANGSIHIGRIEYTPGLMRVFVDILSVPVLQVPLDLDQLLALSGDDAYVGFTAATSNSSEVHKLFTWMLSETPPTTSGNTPPAAPPIKNPCASSTRWPCTATRCSTGWPTTRRCAGTRRCCASRRSPSSCRPRTAGRARSTGAGRRATPTGTAAGRRRPRRDPSLRRRRRPQPGRTRAKA